MEMGVEREEGRGMVMVPMFHWPPERGSRRMRVRVVG